MNKLLLIPLIAIFVVPMAAVYAEDAKVLTMIGAKCLSFDDGNDMAICGDLNAIQDSWENFAGQWNGKLNNMNAGISNNRENIQINRDIIVDLRDNPPQGPQGEKGDRGERGVDGLNGADGSKGNPGQKGDTGPAGTNGKDGTNGLDGKDGLNGTNGINGQDGLDGQPGDQGIPGQNGIDGTNGLKGDKGDTGARGPQGVAGTDGQKGDTGSQGPKGDTGPQGASGTNGKDSSFGNTIYEAKFNSANDFNDWRETTSTGTAGIDKYNLSIENGYLVFTGYGNNFAIPEITVEIDIENLNEFDDPILEFNFETFASTPFKLDSTLILRPDRSSEFIKVDLEELVTSTDSFGGNKRLKAVYQSEGLGEFLQNSEELEVEIGISKGTSTDPVTFRLDNVRLYT